MNVTTNGGGNKRQYGMVEESDMTDDMDDDRSQGSNGKKMRGVVSEGVLGLVIRFRIQNLAKIR